MTRDQKEQNSTTGKRGAVRNNSGLPVGHSGPDLGVGPGTPRTSGRNPEACPPVLSAGFEKAPDLSCQFVSAEADGSDRWQREALLLSQGKSGREFESGALSGASEASGVARREAERGVSSLDEIQNNRNTEHLQALEAVENGHWDSVDLSDAVNSACTENFRKLGRQRYCGVWTVAGLSRDGKKVRIHRLNCKCWSCCYCGPRKAKRYKYLIGQIAEREQLTRFLTLTLDPLKIQGNSVPYLRSVFDKFRLYLRRRYGVPVKYIAVLEFHKSGVAHLHLLVDRYVPWGWIKQSWSALGGGEIVFIKYVDVHRIARYLSKYLTKELLLSAPQRSRRVTTSRSIRLMENKKETAWILFKVSIFYLYSRLYLLVGELHLDEDGMLESFSYASGAA